MNSVVYILDPFGYVRAYSEALAGNLSRRIPAKLLTTGLTQVRGPLDRGDQAVTRFFLRWTSILKRRIPWIPKVILIMLGLPEYVADLFRLRSLRQNFAIFHWQWIPLPLLTVPILWLFDIPVDVLTCHDLIPNGQIDKTRLPWSSYLSLKVARLVVFHSAKLESEALVMAPFLCGKTRVIPHGLLFEGEGRDPGLIPLRRIGMVGLLKDYKGLDDLMDAWSRVWSAAEASGTVLRIFGDCRLSTNRKAVLLNRLQSAPRVEWNFGYLSESQFKVELQRLDLLVLPYTHCFQSGVALAALGLGVPLLVSDAGALSEILEGGQERWTFKAGNVAALTEKLLDFLALSPESLSAYRIWIRERSTRFGKDVIVPAHLGVYRMLTHTAQVGLLHGVE